MSDIGSKISHFLSSNGNLLTLLATLSAGTAGVATFSLKDQVAALDEKLKKSTYLEAEQNRKEKSYEKVNSLLSTGSADKAKNAFNYVNIVLEGDTPTQRQLFKFIMNYPNTPQVVNLECQQMLASLNGLSEEFQSKEPLLAELTEAEEAKEKSANANHDREMVMMATPYPKASYSSPSEPPVAPKIVAKKSPATLPPGVFTDDTYSNYRIDLFYTTSTNERAKELLKFFELLQAAGKIKEVRLRFLSDGVNSQSGYNIFTNQIRFDSNEEDIAAETQKFLDKYSEKLIFNLHQSKMKTSNYLSVFLVE